MWPFKKKEASTSTYTEQVLDQAVQEASGSGVKEPIAAMVACANLYGAKLVQCKVVGSVLINKLHLLDIGRDVVKYGHSRLVIVGGNPYQLVRPIRADKLSKGGWQVTLREGFIDRNIKILDDEIINFVYNPDFYYPWRGKPLWKSATARLATNIDRVMSDEAGGASGKFIWINGAIFPDEDARRKEMVKLRNVFDFTGRNRGRFKGILNPAPQSKEQPQKTVRIGPDWPDALEKTRAQLFKEICASCNVPPELILGGAAGTIREGNRQFGMVMQTVCDLLAMVLSDGLGVHVELSARPLLKVDLVSRARSVGSLTKAGVPVADALQMCGFENGK